MNKFSSSASSLSFVSKTFPYRNSNINFKHHNYARFYRKVNTITNSANLLNDFNTGFPLNIFQNVFTNIHYGYDITTPKLIVLQFGIVSRKFPGFWGSWEFALQRDRFPKNQTCTAE